MALQITTSRFFLIVLLAASAGTFNSCSSKEDPVGGPSVRFPLASEQKIDATRLAQAYDAARLNHGVKCLLVARNGVLVGEEYFSNDGRDSLYHVRSVTKSVVSVLFGIAVDRGLIWSLDLTVKDLLSGLVDSMSATTGSITIRNLLTMSGGFQWEELRTDNDLAFWSNSNNKVAHVLGLPIADSPGTQFTYNTAACQLLSAIFRVTTGMSLYDFAMSNLFQPLGMLGARPWEKDAQGFHYGGYRLSLTPIDMLNIGHLYLNEGEFGGRQIVSAEWVRASTRAQISTANIMPYGPSYGYLWWVGRYGTYDYYFANGYGGQFIVNVPTLRLVVVARSDWIGTGRTADEQWMQTMDIIMTRVLPAVQP
jgi:CubicO group peptidase (beta-lactamase class C family)